VDCHLHLPIFSGDRPATSEFSAKPRLLFACKQVVCRWRLPILRYISGCHFTSYNFLVMIQTWSG